MKICYEDNHIIIVYKPRNMLSQKDYTNDDSLVEEVKSYLKLKYILSDGHQQLSEVYVMMKYDFYGEENEAI